MMECDGRTATTTTSSSHNNLEEDDDVSTSGTFKMMESGGRTTTTTSSSSHNNIEEDDDDDIECAGSMLHIHNLFEAPVWPTSALGRRLRAQPLSGEDLFAEPPAVPLVQPTGPPLDMARREVRHLVHTQRVSCCLSFPFFAEIGQC